MPSLRPFLQLSLVCLWAALHPSDARTVIATSGGAIRSENGPFTGPFAVSREMSLGSSFEQTMPLLLMKYLRGRREKKAKARRKTTAKQSTTTEQSTTMKGESSTNGWRNESKIMNEKESGKNGKAIDERKREAFLKKVQTVPITDEHALELFQHWTDQAFSNFFAVVANNKLMELKKPVHTDFADCSGKAKSVPMHAKCVSDLLNGKFDATEYLEKAKERSHRFDQYRMNKRGQFRREKEAKKHDKDRDWVGSFRMMDSPLPAKEPHNSSHWDVHIAREYATNRRDRRQTGVVKKNYYELLTPSESRVSPMGKIAQMMMKGVLKAKGKHQNDVVPWQQTVQRIQNSATKRKAIKKALEQDSVESLDQLRYRGLKRQGAIKEDIEEYFDNPQKLRKFLEKKDPQKDPSARIVNLFREALKLGYAFAGNNMTEMDNKTMKMVSPRFMSVVPEDEQSKNDTLDFLSPSLFSLHNMGSGLENLTSIPNLLKNIGGHIGFNSQDQQLWLDFIMEASGVIESADKIENELNGTDFAAGRNGSEKGLWPKNYDKERYQKEMRTKDGTPLYFTKQNISDAFAESETNKVEVIETLQKNISRAQIKEMNSTGFALLTPEQLELVYGQESGYHDPEALELFKSMNRSAILAHIERDIHSLALIKSFKITPKETTSVTAPRSKRAAVVLSPVSFSSFIVTAALLDPTPIILSPVIFTPLILAPAVLGPIVLSPWLFVPVILSPRLLSPAILVPALFVPIILSPLALDPLILVPGAFNPFILSPVLMSPFILSPQVFTPFILSPMALNPFILNPGAGIPIVLSPFVLTPIIYSPMAFSALVLSPYALSPIIQSPLFYYSVILSPSYLS